MELKKIMVLVLVLVITGILFAGTEKAGKFKPALLVIDVQNAYLPYMSDQDKKFAFEMINAAIELFRKSGFPVIRVYHTDPKQGPAPDSEAFQFPASIAVQPDDPKIIKNYASGFKKTDLHKLLQEKGCNTLFLCGLSAVGCVLATYRGADDLDYQAFMIQGGLISHDADLTRAVEQFTQTIGYGALKLLLESAAK